MERLRLAQHPAAVVKAESWDPLHSATSEDLHWTTANLGEAMPGVLTPLSWTTWAYAVEHAPREAGYAIGALTRSERVVPSRREDWFVRVFYGRPAMQVEFLALLGDRMPGTTGRDTVAGYFGEAPDDLAYHPTARRYPIIAARLPYLFARLPGRIRATAEATDHWYARSIATVDTLDRAACVALFRDALERLDQTVTLQTMSNFAIIQPLYGALEKLVTATGVGDLSILSGSGGAEMAVVSDIWRASRSATSVEAVARTHGFHGPMEGELSSRVWREDDTPLRRMAAEYTQRPDREDPRVAERDRRRRYAETVTELLAALPRLRRPGARVVLRLAARRIPLRGVVKRSFLQSIDVARASARRIGAGLAAGGTLAEADDVFYLTADELTGPVPSSVAELVERRRRRRSEYLALTVPGAWAGSPTTQPAVPDAGHNTVVTGVSASGGVAEGIARVVTDPSFTDVEPDEILIAPTTDPSWSSIMFISKALVVDIGGPLSHAAVVARELGIPCVVGAADATRTVRTGDLVRVDGDAGTVEIRERGPG